MRRLAVLLCVGSLALGAGAASATVRSPATAAKTCSAGYVRANLSWGVKCLRAGEFCVVGNAEYHHYGYTCPASRHLAYYRGHR